jgi:hypothetical protein
LFGAFLDSLFACAQGSRVITVVVQVGEVKIYVAADETRRSGKRKDRMKLKFITKIGGKTSLRPSYFILIKFSFPVTRLMPYYVETGRSRPLIA